MTCATCGTQVRGFVLLCFFSRVDSALNGSQSTHAGRSSPVMWQQHIRTTVVTSCWPLSVVFLGQRSAGLEHTSQLLHCMVLQTVPPLRCCTTSCTPSLQDKQSQVLWLWRRWRPTIVVVDSLESLLMSITVCLDETECFAEITANCACRYQVCC